jgi:hypothetical protein
MRAPSLTFYLGRMPETIEMHELEARIERGDSPLFVFVDVDLGAIPPGARARLAEVGRWGKFVVLAAGG